MRKPLLRVLLSFLLCSSSVSAETPHWKLKQNDLVISAERTGTAKIDELRVEAVLKLECNRHGASLRFEISEYDKVQRVFDLRIFEGPSAPTLSLALTTVGLDGVSPAQSLSFRQNGFISVGGRFVIETSHLRANSIALAQFYRRIAAEGEFLGIRIKSYRDPGQFISSEFPLNHSREAIKALAAACPWL